MASEDAPAAEGGMAAHDKAAGRAPPPPPQSMGDASQPVATDVTCRPCRSPLLEGVADDTNDEDAAAAYAKAKAKGDAASEAANAANKAKKALEKPKPLTGAAAKAAYRASLEARQKAAQKPKKEKKSKKEKAPDIPEEDIQFMDTVRKHIQATGPLRSNHLNAFYKAHPEITRKGSGAGQWIATRAEKYGIIVIKPAKYGGPLEFQLAPSNSRKLNIVADRQDDRPPTQLPKKDERKEKLEQKRVNERADERIRKEKSKLPYGGDVQEAIRKKDRKAIRLLMKQQHNNKMPSVDSFLRDSHLIQDYAWLVPLLQENEIDMEALALLDDADYEEMAVDKKTRRVVRNALKKWGTQPSASEKKKGRTVEVVKTEKQRVCKIYRDTGSCRFGVKCRDRHDVPYSSEPPKKSPRAQRSVATQGDKDGAGLCRRWKQEGSCVFGAKCRFAHGAPLAREAPSRVASPREPRVDSRVVEARKNVEAEHQKLAAEAKAVSEARDALAAERRALAEEQAKALDERRRVAKMRREREEVVKREDAAKAQRERERDELMKQREKIDAQRARAEADFAALQRLELGRRGPPPPRPRAERSNSFNATAQPYQPAPPDFAGAVDRSYPPRQNTLQPPVRSYSAMRGGGYMQGAAPADGRFAAEYNNQGGFYGQGPPSPYPPQQYGAPPPMPPVPPQQMQPPPQNFY